MTYQESGKNAQRAEPHPKKNVPFEFTSESSSSGAFMSDIAQLFVTGVVTEPIRGYKRARDIVRGFRNGGAKTVEQSSSGAHVISKPGFPVDLQVEPHHEGDGSTFKLLRFDRSGLGEPRMPVSLEGVVWVAVASDYADKAHSEADNHGRHVELLSAGTHPDAQSGLKQVAAGEKSSHVFEKGTTFVAFDKLRKHSEIVRMTVREPNKVEHEIVNQVNGAFYEKRRGEDQLRTSPIHLNLFGTTDNFNTLKFRFPKVEYVKGEEKVVIDDTPEKGKNVLLVGDPLDISVSPEEARLFPGVDISIERNDKAEYQLVVDGGGGVLGINGVVGSDGVLFGRAIDSRTVIPLKKGKIRLQNYTNTEQARDALTVIFDGDPDDPAVVVEGPDRGSKEKSLTYDTVIATFAAGREIRQRRIEEQEAKLKEFERLAKEARISNQPKVDRHRFNPLRK